MGLTGRNVGKKRLRANRVTTRGIVLNALLIAAAVGGVADPGATPAEFIDDVKFIFNVVTCQGGALPETFDAKVVAWYCERQRPSLARFTEHWGTGGKAFLTSLRPASLPPELVYPFGGGDMMMALTSYPDAKVITTLSLELAGDPRRFKLVKDAVVLRQNLQALLMTSTTTLLSNDSKSVNLSSIQRGELPGQLSMHFIGLALHDMEPVSVRFFRIEPDGSLHYYTHPEIDAAQATKAHNLKAEWKSPDFSPAFANVEVQFVPKGQPEAPRRIHRHIAADLSNGGFQKNPGLLAHLEAKGHITAMTKAASYLLWNSNFSVIRDYLVGHLDFMFSDSTGLLPRYAKKAGLTIETYGSFQKSFLNTAQGSQDELRHEFASQPKRPLPMRFGYPDGSPEKRSHLIVVRRPPTVDAGAAPF